MNKKESLAFLQSCIESINVASDEEIALFQESYALNCVEPIVSSAFEFIPPTDIVGCLYETNKVRQIKISTTECVVDLSKSQWGYNLRGICTSNEQSGEIPFAA